MQPDRDLPRVDEVLNRVYRWSAERHYRGYNKHDGLNSPLLKATLGWSKWPRIVAIQAVMRSPVNLRPLLAVAPAENPKGLALFTQGLLDRFRVSGDGTYLAQAQLLLNRLETLASPGDWSGICWGYHYPWQDPGFYAPPGTPNAVVTCFVCEAFLDAAELTGDERYLAVALDACKFLSSDLTVLKDEGGELCVSYMPMPMRMRVMDVSVLIGSVLARCEKLSGGNRYRDYAARLVNYVLARQTAEGAWFYTDPPEDSMIRHDNYHTGFILDALDRYRTAGGDCAVPDSAYDTGLAFYATRLFNDDGSPRWMSDKDFPHDIHGAAQGILTFSRHQEGYPQLAERILDWTLQHLYEELGEGESGGGRFLYQQTRHYTKSFTLMRWCNAWMCRALAHYRYRCSLTDAATASLGS